MKIAILAVLRAVLRPLAAIMFPEQFTERTAYAQPSTADQNPIREIVVSSTPPEFKAHVLNKLRREHLFDDLDHTSTEAEIRHAIGYNQCIKHLDKLWEVR
jgi:hypothetical protein